MRICLHKPGPSNQHIATETRGSRSAFLVAALGLASVPAGCIKPPPPYVPVHRQPPAMAHCFDGVPHLNGSKPWIVGGKCCCTPSDELMKKLHADGSCTELDAGGLIDLYHEKGIQLVIDHAGCNNLCRYGPHVTRGGHCMVPPTPGTRNYEEVVTGIVLTSAMPCGPNK